MPISPYLRELRARVGTDLLLIPSVAAIVRDPAGRILFQRRSDNNQWSLPAGGIDPGEEPAQAVVREVWEEAGLRVVPERLLGVLSGAACRYTYPNGDQVEPTIIVFECRIAGGTLEARDGESLELCYFELDELPSLGIPYPPEAFASPAPGAPPFFRWDPAWIESLDPEH